MPFLPPPTPANELRGDQLAERLAYVFYRFRDRLTTPDWDALHEAVRRLKQHEQLLRSVVPDLRNQIADLEAALARYLPRD
jgi:hypothetical protein